jgi:hypothetical protein
MILLVSMFLPMSICSLFRRTLVCSLILLIAMIGAIVLTMHKTTQVKRQDVF